MFIILHWICLHSSTVQYLWIVVTGGRNVCWLVLSLCHGEIWVEFSPVAVSVKNVAAAKLLQSCLTLRDPMDCSLPGSSIHGIFQARELEWGAIAFSDLWPCCCYCQVASVVSDFVWLRRRQPTRLPRPWDSPGKNTGVGCHFLLQGMKGKVKVKSLSRGRLLGTPWTAAYQAPPSMGFSRQENWSGVPLPSLNTSNTSY